MKRLPVLAISVMITIVAKHAYSSGFLGGGGVGGGVDVGGKYGINVETLTGDKVLVPGVDEMYQYLDPNGSHRTITLDTSTAKAGDRFVIRNNGPHNSAYKLLVQQAGSIQLDQIVAGGIKGFIFDGANWIAERLGTGENDNKISSVSIGYLAFGHNFGVAVGNLSGGYTYGAAVGNNAKGYNQGVAVGSSSNGNNWGVAVGGSSYGSNYGAAAGGHALGYNYGAAVGFYAKGMRYGVAAGYEAGYNLDETADRYNILVGAYAGYQLTTGTGNIILGYQSGYDATYSPTTGSKNIIIGYQAGTPDNTTSNFLNIGNLVFASGINTDTGTGISDGKVGIKTANPNSVLHVNGSISFPIAEITADTTLDDTHYTVLCDASTAAVTITLPSVSGITGRIYNIKKIDNTANTCTVAASGTETIDGVASQDISTQYGVITVQAGSSGWFRLH